MEICEGFEVCGYRNGHLKEMREEANKKRAEEKEVKVKQKKEDKVSNLGQDSDLYLSGEDVLNQSISEGLKISMLY